MTTPIDISASTGAKILNVSKWGTQFEAWQWLMEGREPGFNDSHGYTLPEQPDNASIRWGKAFETAIIELAENIQDSRIINREVFLRHKKYDFITCHLDGKYSHSEGKIHEGKTTNIWTFGDEWGEPGTDRIPLDIRIQVEHQMLVTGMKNVIVSVLVFPKRPQEWEDMGYDLVNIVANREYFITNKNVDGINCNQWAYSLNEMGYFHQYHIESSKALQDTMIDYYVPWWEKHVINKIPPEPGNYPDLSRIIKKPVGTIICPKEIEDWKNEFVKIKQEINRVEKRREQIKTAVIGYGRMTSEGQNNPIDDDSVEKWVFRNEFGEKLFTWNGKTFRAGKE